MSEPLYTISQCEAQIRIIDESMSKIILIPPSAGADGVYYSNAGRVRELMELRDRWESLLTTARAFEENGRPRGQGPDYEVW
jgi:hypothetical protein